MTFGDTVEVATCRTSGENRYQNCDQRLGLGDGVERPQPPQVGDLTIVADGAGEPLCVIEITEVVINPFYEIDEQLA
ncbi:MAG: ASCH domain-containing protein [Caldilineaceae bacterium]